MHLEAAGERPSGFFYTQAGDNAMMLHYLKKTHDSNVDDVKEVDNMQAKVLIKLGLAKEHVKTPEKRQKPAPKPKSE